ncbi:early nodulin-like protein 2 [Ipomoea triloba]|uniref:early nodulin-like protein 2 n=1 Tax=Ipomoea triloba TaxID=35885 RepID=UPI00125E693C|nr:early nodulin-like protein 2 [Ipomoea triloba]
MYTHRHPLIILGFLVSLHFYSSTSYAVSPDISGRDKGPFGVSKSDEKGSNLVLEVSKEDYENCNTKNPPIKKMDYGNSMFQFGRSGTIYIISGNQESCEKGQKFIIAVPPPPTANQETPLSSSKGSSPPSLSLGRVSEVAPTKTITPYRQAPKAVSPKGFVTCTPISYSPTKRFTPASPEVVIPTKSSISSSPNTLSSSHAPVKAPSHTATTSISPSIASKLPSSSLSPTTPHAPLSSNMSPQGSRIIPSSSPTPLTAPSSNKSPVTSPQRPSIIAPTPSGSPQKSNSAIGMPITPTLIFASLLSLLPYNNYLLFIIN